MFFFSFLQAKWFLSVVALSATWCCSAAFVVGVAEVVYRDGMVWCHAPIGYAIGIILGEPW